MGSYTSHYFGVKVYQPTESRLGINLTSVERAIRVMNILDEEEKSRGYLCKAEGYRPEIFARSAKAERSAVEISQVKDFVASLVREKIATLNTQQNVFPVECSCGGAQMFIERTNIDFSRISGNGSIAPQSYINCFYLDPSRPGQKNSVSIRYYKTYTGKCQYTYFANDLRGIFGEAIASSIADHKKLLKATVNKYLEVEKQIEEALKFTSEELAAINERFNQTVVSN